MKNLLIVLTLLISFTATAQSDVYQLDVKEVLFTINFYALPYNSKYYNIDLEKFSDEDKNKILLVLQEELEMYPQSILQLITPEMFFVSAISSKIDGDDINGVCWANVKMAIDPYQFMYGYTKTLHHEIFHSIVHSIEGSGFSIESAERNIVVNENYYAAGHATELGRISSSEEDYAEIFSHLMTKEEIIKFYVNNPNSTLADKVNNIIQLINKADETINFNFFKNIK